MNLKLGAGLFLLSGTIAVGILCTALAWSTEPPANSANNGSVKEDLAKPADDENRVTVAVARDRAKLMHNVYAATLEMLHHHYFQANKAVLPARAMEDVFEEMSRQSNVKARWIAVNTKAMSVPHEPKTDFEKSAAAEIAGGKVEFERVENGYYQRAGAIPLSGGCVSCHTTFLMTPPRTPRFAGLVISIPVNEK